MKKHLPFLCLLLLTSCVTPPVTCFNPGGDCNGLIVQHIQDARKSIHVAAYSMANDSIADALRLAVSRGVHVEVILDRTQRTAAGSDAGKLAASGVVVWVDSSHPIFHDIYFILDSGTVITGSMNPTKKGAKENAENVMVIQDLRTASKFLADWNRHVSHSDRL